MAACIAAIGSVLLAVGCGESPPAPPAAPAPARPAAQAAPAAQPPTVAEPETYTYNPAGRRDPFRSLIITGGKKNVEFLPPLQRREVSELKFVAVVWGNLGTYGMIEMPDGKGYAVRVGTRVGPNHGVVKRITAKDLTVLERYVDFFGETRTREVVLELRTREEGLE
ncbi:MAG: pilus assembly protein PilP [Nitrospirae bacterium]|nr:pilus assembly protein PilP [Nitrospirota bacterium]